MSGRPPSHRGDALSRAARAALRALVCATLACTDATGDDAPLAPTSARLDLGTLSWTTIASPNRGTTSNELRDLAIVTATDIWAVGDYNPTTDLASSLRRTLVERWNGTAWQLVASPNATWSGVDVSTLQAVAAVSATNVWAVGYAADLATFRSTTLVMRWNGAQWTIVPSPNPAGASAPNRLHDLAVVSANDIWAVGEQGYPQRALILRWNGVSWTNVPNTCGGPLRAISALSATALWAVGDNTTCRYNGQGWTRIAPAQNAAFFDVAAVTSTLVWSVGQRVYCSAYYCVSVGASVLERWNGSRWAAVAHPLFSTLNGVDALAANDAWAVGDSASRGAILHWDGIAWRQQRAPAPGFGSSLNAVAALTSTRTWAVGWYYDANGSRRTWTIRR
jgi:hypothetical protein